MFDLWTFTDKLWVLSVPAMRELFTHACPEIHFCLMWVRICYFCYVRVQEGQKKKISFGEIFGVVRHLCGNKASQEKKSL